MNVVVGRSIQSAKQLVNQQLFDQFLIVHFVAHNQTIKFTLLQVLGKLASGSFPGSNLIMGSTTSSWEIPAASTWWSSTPRTVCRSNELSCSSGWISYGREFLQLNQSVRFHNSCLEIPWRWHGNSRAAWLYIHYIPVTQCFAESRVLAYAYYVI